MSGSSSITTLQRDLTVAWHEAAPEAGRAGFPGLVEANHLQNFLLWHEEDVARRDDLGPARVAEAKRAIDRFNQARNDGIEQLDRFLVDELEPPAEGVPFNSESPGMIIDRLSILALKEYHMAEEAGRSEAPPEHREACRAKLDVLARQRGDLARAYDELLADVAARRRSFRVYFQFKMYNDPQLNPQLRASGRGER